MGLALIYTATAYKHLISNIYWRGLHIVGCKNVHGKDFQQLILLPICIQTVQPQSINIVSINSEFTQMH